MRRCESRDVAPRDHQSKRLRGISQASGNHANSPSANLRIGDHDSLDVVDGVWRSRRLEIVAESVLALRIVGEKVQIVDQVRAREIRVDHRNPQRHRWIVDGNWEILLLALLELSILIEEKNFSRRRGRQNAAELDSPPTLLVVRPRA